ncbi:Leucine-rich repeat containing protein [Entamoeba marina]
MFNLSSLHQFAMTSFEGKNKGYDEVPAEAMKLRKTCVRLDLSLNKIDKLEPEFSKFSLLTSLRLRGNYLDTFPDPIFDLQALKILDLSNNTLSILPPEIACLPHLSELIMGQNIISEIPPEIGQMTNLVNFTFPANRLMTLPTEMSNLSALTCVDLSNNNFYEFPSVLGKLSNIRTLWLFHNNLYKLKGIDGKWFFTNCLIRSIPHELTCLTNLSELIIIRSRVNKFPKFLRQLPKLSNFILTDSLLTRGDLTIDNCCMLLDSNRLTSLHCVENDNVFSLSLKNNLIKRIPNTNELQSIEELDLTNNQIFQLEQNNLHPGLKRLSLASNKIITMHFPFLPSSLFTFLPHLHKFFADINQLSTLPTSLTLLHNLKELKLSHNLFTEIPPDVLALTTLTNLFMTHNLLSEIPSGITKLQNLQVVDLSCNNLTTINNIIPCNLIRSLSLSFNKNLDITPELTQMEHLEDVSYTGTVQLMKYPLDISFVKKLHRKRPQTIIHTPLLFLDSARCNQLKLPLSAPQFEENDCVCPVEIGTSNMCGVRDSMQDTMVAITNYLGVGFHFLSIFDGHIGINCSCFCASQFPECFASILTKDARLSIEDALTQVFKTINTRIDQAKFKDGTAANVVLVTPKQYFVANVGDSRCILVRRNSILTLNEDHTIVNADELQRVRSADGFIEKAKVNGEIVLTRTLGDLHCADVVECTPHISCYERAVDDVCVVLCCDGVFDVLSNEEVGEICRKKSNEPACVLAATIRDLAYSSGCKDNISCIVCKLVS